MLFKNPVRTSKRTPHFTITKINWLTLFKFNGYERPQGVICCEVLANEPLKANKSMRHLKTKHGSIADRSAEF
jgi:hypothetical protein